MQLVENTVQQSAAPATTSRPQRLGEDSTLTLAMATSQALRALPGLKLAELGLASGQDRLLMVLAERGKLSVSALADELNVRPSTVFKMMDRLAARGYTQRTPDTQDARRIFVQLTPDGWEICDRLRSLWNDIDMELSADMSSSDVSRIFEGLTLLHDRVEQRLRRLR